MEVTTVSPFPASPTEGDDLCETDVTDVVIHSGTLLICLCGLVGNGAVICLYPLKSRTYAFFDVAVADFLFLLFTVPSTLLFLVEDVSCSPVTLLMYMSFLFQLSMVSSYWGLYRLTLYSDVGNIFALCKLCCRCKPPTRLLMLAFSVQDWAFFALFTVVPTLSSLCPSQKQEHCRAALISMFTIILLLFIVPMVISITINIIKVKCGSKKQQPKRRHIVIFITVLFTLPLFLCNFLQLLGYIPVSTQGFFLLTCIHSSIKPIIYFLAERCWSPCSMGSLRHSLQRVFEEKKEIIAHRNDAPRDTGV